MIRKTNIDDLDKIVKLELKIFKESLGLSFLKQELLDNPASNILVYEIDNNIVGYISYRLTDKYAEILNFLVDTEYQNMGYGSKLLQYVLHELRIEEAVSLILEVRKSNYRAIRFYQRFGALIVKEIPNYYKNEDALVLLMEVKKDDNFIS